MLPALRDAKWIDKGRALGYPAILLVILWMTVVWLVSTSHGMVSTMGAPIGTDFTSFRAAVSLAAKGSPENAYDPTAHRESERKLFAGRDIPYYSFFYPPPFLLLCLPLALLPYGAALFAWLGLTGLAYWRALRNFLPQKRAIVPILAFPAFFVNSIYGQNGFLSGALMGFGTFWLGRRPILAGCCYGGLIYKPHLGILIPIVLIAAKAWRTFFAAGATAVALALASWAVFGTQTWEAFFNSNRLAREALEQNQIGYEKIESLFAFLRSAGLNLTYAYIAQALFAFAAGSAVIWLAWKRPAGPALGAALAAGTLLISPFLLPYDLAIVGVPIAWLAAEGLSTGFRPWEKLTLLFAYFLPLIAQVTAQAKQAIPWTPVVVSLLLLAVVRRTMDTCEPSPTKIHVKRSDIERRAFQPLAPTR